LARSLGESPQPPKSLSLTDPQAALTSKGRSKIAFAYGTNYLIDTKAAIIVDVEASPARWTAEVAATRTMIERAAKRFGLTPKRLAADTAYGSGGNLAWLMQRGIEPHIPVLDRSAQTNGVFTRNDFTFDRANNAFICPGGKDLRLTLERNNGVLIYRARSRDCAHCPLKLQCTTAPNGHCPSARMTRCASMSPVSRPLPRSNNRLANAGRSRCCSRI
jgi:hypothetical protein